MYIFSETNLSIYSCTSGVQSYTYHTHNMSLCDPPHNTEVPKLCIVMPQGAARYSLGHSVVLTTWKGDHDLMAVNVNGRRRVRVAGRAPMCGFHALRKSLLHYQSLTAICGVTVSLQTHK